MKVYENKLFKLIIIFFTLIILPSVGSSKSIKNKLDTNLIDPDQHVYGIPLGTSEDKFRNMFGAPSGYFRYSSTSTGMLYGKNHLFYFINQRLYGVKIGNPAIIDPYLNRKLSAHSILGHVKWILTNGIGTDSSLRDIMEILGDKINIEPYFAYYETKSTMIKFALSYNPALGKGPEAYQVNSIEIERYYNAELPASH